MFRAGGGRCFTALLPLTTFSLTTYVKFKWINNSLWIEERELRNTYTFIYIFNFVEQSRWLCPVPLLDMEYIHVCIYMCAYLPELGYKLPQMPIGIIGDAHFWRHDTRQAKKTPPVLCLPHHVQQPQLQQQQLLPDLLPGTLSKLALPPPPGHPSAALVPHLYLSQHTLGRSLFVSRFPLPLHPLPPLLLLQFCCGFNFILYFFLAAQRRKT